MSIKQPWSIESMRQIAGTKKLHEGRMAEVDQILQDVASGDLDAYTVMNHPTSPEENYAAQQLQQMYDTVAQDQGLHADDDFEQILDIVCDNLSKQYGDQQPAPAPRSPMSAEVTEMRRMAGLPLMEAKAADEPDEPNETAIAKRKRLQAIKDKLEDERAERGDDDKKEKSAVRTVAGKAYGGSKQKEESSDEEDETPAKKEAPAAEKKEAPKAEKAAPAEKKEESGSAPASDAKFASLARSFLAHNPNASAADVRAHCVKAGCTPPAHFHSRLSGIKASVKKSMLKKGVKEGFILIHPQMPSFVLAENMAMNQYQWVSMKDEKSSLEPMMFVTEADAKKVMLYVKEYKNQACILTPVKLED